MAGLNTRIMKITGMFGTLQVTNILCSIVRVKLVAIWIGPIGVGLFGLFNSALDTINAISQLGIRQSAVADLASSPRERLPRLVRVIRRWSLALGIAGALFTLIFSGWLSRATFGTDGYRWAFAWLSVTVLLASVNNGEGAVFQGLQRFRKLAVCSMLGSIGGLAVSVPMFYFWRIDSVVPSIIAYSAVTWMAMGLYRERVERPDEPISLKATLTIGKKFLMLGIYMTVTAAVTNLISYLFMAYLNHDADLNATGYYNAGFTLVNRYAGLVFTAISMEFYPRLASVVHSRRRMGVYVSNQIYLSLTILVPVATLFIGCAPWVIRLFYSSDFSEMLPFVVWAMPGTAFRAISWCMAFVILAHSDGRVFLVTELLSCAVALSLNILGFRLWGYEGIGLAYFAWYAIYTLIIAVPYYLRYGLRLESRLPLFMLYSVGLTAVAAFMALRIAPWTAFPLAAAASLISYIMLRRSL